MINLPIALNRAGISALANRWPFRFAEMPKYYRPLRQTTMPEELILPEFAPVRSGVHYPNADPEIISQIIDWYDDKLNQIREIWKHRPHASTSTPRKPSLSLADEIIATLLRHRFNHQSRGRLSHLIPQLRSILTRHVSADNPIPLYFLYNGGYRASPFPGRFELIFEPDQTELMLIYQASLLQQEVTAIYHPGIDFVIVVNNGVASWVNGIPVSATTAYASKLRAMMDSLGASKGIRVLLQSDLGGFDEMLRDELAPGREPPALSDKKHRIIERFLGRRCDEREARHRAALYTLAESIWGETLREIEASEAAVMLRQVAYPDMLSFRPFPGGAIRAQNGSLGFKRLDDRLLPRLMTSEGFHAHPVKMARLDRRLINTECLSA